MSPRQTLAELVGTAALLAVIVGSAVMAGRLAAEAPAVALLCNTLATGAGLIAILTALGDTGCTLNPAATILDAAFARVALRAGVARIAVQLAGAVVGVVAAHAMFGLPLVAWSQTLRDGGAPALSEWLATTGLLVVAGRTADRAPERVPVVVACYVIAGYWFTSSMCFANPAVTFARMFTATPAGIAPSSAATFVLGEVLAIPTAALLLRALRAPPGDLS